MIRFSKFKDVTTGETPEVVLFYISFATNGGWLGGCFVLMDEATANNPLPFLNKLGLNPGGEMLVIPHPAKVGSEKLHQPEQKYWNRLIIDPKELEEAFQDKVHKITDVTPEQQARFDSNLRGFGNVICETCNEPTDDPV